MNKYKEFLNKEIIAVYKISNVGINLRIRGILIADINEEIVIRSTSEVGNNGKVKSKKIIDIKLPEFEMLGDYKTYIRYKFGGTEYLGDWLKIDENKYIAVYIWDKSGKLTKVSPNADRIEVVEYELSE